MAAITEADLPNWFAQMVQIRVFEEKVQELFMDGSIQGTTHLCQGQEGVSVGAMAAIGDDDYITITYRGHGHALAKGVPPQSAFAELIGRRSGCCRGVGGSMHLTDFSRNLIGAFAIVGAGLPVAVGAAVSAQMRGEPSVALAFCGDGSTNIGTFHESLNMAAVWKAPVVFIVENNLYGEYTPLRNTTPVDDLAERALAHGIPGVITDGQDVCDVFVKVSEAVERARSGAGPSLIEAKTYRYVGHSRTDPGRYRPDGELDRWRERDPIELLGARLAASGQLSADAQSELRERIRSEIDRDAEAAFASPLPTLEEARSYVYA